jgi:hypothetical protein
MLQEHGVVAWRLLKKSVNGEKHSGFCLILLSFNPLSRLTVFFGGIPEFPTG